MYALNIAKKTGFTVVDRNTPIVIRDNRGILFYDTTPITPRVQKFNLPRGKYIVDSGNFKIRPKPVKYRLAELPIYCNRVGYPSPSKFKIMYGDNPNKCSVIWDKKVIVFDNSFKEKPRSHVYFILMHEWAHRYFNGQREDCCDIWASNAMKILGYNPSQIGLAQIYSLSDAQNFRKNVLVNKLIKSR